MKKLTNIVLILMFCWVTACYADVDITITIPTAKVARVQAWANANKQDGDTDMQFVKKSILDHLKYRIFVYERNLAEETYVQSIQEEDMAQ